MTYIRTSKDKIREKAQYSKPDTFDFCDEQDSGFDERRYNAHVEHYEAHIASLKEYTMHSSLIALMDREERTEIEDSEIYMAVVCPECGGDSKAKCTGIAHGDRSPMAFFGNVFCVSCDNTGKADEDCHLCKGKGTITDAYEFYSNGGYDSPNEWLAFSSQNELKK
jgi:hypothetical protein